MNWIEQQLRHKIKVLTQNWAEREQLLTITNPQALEYVELEQKIKDQAQEINELTTKKDNLAEDLTHTQTELTTIKQDLVDREQTIIQERQKQQERENYWQNKQKEWKQKKIAIKKELAQQVQDYQELTHEKAITDQTLTDIHQSFHQGQEIVKEMEELVVDLLEINKSGVGNSKVKQLAANFRKLKGKMKWGVE